MNEHLNKQRTPKRDHDEYVRELADVFEKQGYKVIVEGSIPKYRWTGEWGEPDLFVLKKIEGRLTIEKIAEVIISDKKEGQRTKTTTTLEDKVRKIKDYYDPPELIVFEPMGFTSAFYDAETETKGKFKDQYEYNEYLGKKWKKEGINVVFWEEWKLEELKHEGE